MKEVLEKLYQGERLAELEAKQLLINIAQEKYNEAHLSSFMTVFRMRPITVQELLGFRNALKELAIKIDLSDYNTIDIVGTGGDGKNTFNISTLASFVVAGTGQKVAKHGNYSVSSKSGSSNMLEVFGYKFTNDENILKKQLETTNICFLHAPQFHPAMKVVAPTRKALAVKTFFNILGPLVNPSSPKNAMLGTFNREIARLYNYILQNETTNFGIVHAIDGYDEISLTSNFSFFTKKGEDLIDPEDLGYKKIKQTEIYGGNSVSEAATIFSNILEGKGTDSQNNVVLVNAAFALTIVDKTKSFEQALQEVTDSLFQGKAKRCLDRLITN